MNGPDAEQRCDALHYGNHGQADKRTLHIFLAAEDGLPYRYVYCIKHDKRPDIAMQGPVKRGKEVNGFHFLAHGSHFCVVACRTRAATSRV